jgi:cation diffusion facilitator CzcD-associated flavoprotein CzcO
MPKRNASVTAAPEHVDVLIVGAGISGIGVAYHLQEKHPEKNYLILEARDSIGGTWDLFRYPGIRSDSDLHTFGYSFRPWIEDRSIADAPSILNYIRDTASAYGINEQMRFGHRVTSATWSSTEQQWTVEVQAGGERVVFTADWLFGACGYYSYEAGFTPPFEGLDQFEGQVIHPQFWPENLDYAGKRVVVIGSGATAVTIIPAMAEAAEHITMLQRTPSFILAIPAVDPIVAFVKRFVGPKRAHRFAREKNVRLGGLIFKLCKRFPDRMRKLIRAGNVKALPEGFDVDKHFNPPYGPWDQRMCLVPDGDLFAAISSGKASVVTDHIETFTPTGLRLRSGEELAADIVITATGLQMLPFGGMELVVDDDPVALPDTFTYKGMMLSGVPNYAYAFGYTNASWTLRVDIICEHFCKLLTLMDEHEYGQVVPEAPPRGTDSQPLITGFSSGYIQRALAQFPRQGPAPWVLSMDYVRDRKEMLEGPVGDHLRFTASRRPAEHGAAATPVAV